ncbi:MAG: hypothetical protein HYV07_34110 [Deltaproteobacteria bacterium]|nr:hypothetical protein [Deltaproteobacteria bacterium]
MTESAPRSSRREILLASSLLGVGVAATAIALGVREERRKGMVERPDAAGEVGFLSVYAELSRGPTPLLPGVTSVLVKPVDLAFQWTVRGTGPRVARIELVTEARREVLDEVTLSAPADQEALSTIVHLDDSVPAELELVITVEAPHSRAVASSYAIRTVRAASSP